VLDSSSGYFAGVPNLRGFPGIGSSGKPERTRVRVYISGPYHKIAELRQVPLDNHIANTHYFR